MKTLSTNLEIKVAEKILQPNFSFNRFVKISALLIRRQARRSERIRLNLMNKADFLNGFNRNDFPHITQFYSK
jgi:hypothetical protein